MTTADDREFPPSLAAALSIPFHYAGGDGVDFEPFAHFLPAEEATAWIRAWTGNGELTGDAFRVFGQDGTGGYAAFWLIRQDRAMADQPVVFLGSEGDTAVVARDLDDFLWLLAGGYGPLESTASFTDSEPGWTARSHPELTSIAERFAPDRRRSATDIIELAGREFPDFDSIIMELCR